jgi:cobalt-zinc-cadmium efflux system outer membrane protein
MRQYYAWILMFSASANVGAQQLPPPADPIPLDPLPAQVSPVPLNSSDALLPTPAEEPTFEASSIRTLAQIESVAMANHPSIVAATNAVAAAQGRALQAGLYPNPTLQGGALQLGGKETMWAGTVAQEIVVKRKLYLERQAECQAVRQAQFELTRTRFEVLRNVRAGFYRVLALQMRSETLNQLQEIARRSFETGQRLRAGGEGTLTDELQLKIQYRRAAATLQSIDALRTGAMGSLAALTGSPELNLDRVEGNMNLPLPDFEYALVRSGILSQNAEASKAQIEIARRRYILRRALVEPCPNPVIQGGYQYFVGGIGNDDGIQNLPTAMVSFPIPVWNRNQGSIREARSEVSRASYLFRNTQNDLSQRAADALGRLAAARELVAAYEAEILPAAKETLGLAQAAYQGGQLGLLQLLQAQRDLVDAQLGQVDAQEQRWQAAVDLAQLLQLDVFPPTAP